MQRRVSVINLATCMWSNRGQLGMRKWLIVDLKLYHLRKTAKRSINYVLKYNA